MHAAVVDPSRVVLKMVGDLIRERGDTVSEFLDSASALRSLQNDRSIDVLITSLEVQPIGGLELCRDVRLLAVPARPLFIVVMSSLSDDKTLAEVLDSGADHLIVKPVMAVELHARLRQAERQKAAQLRFAGPA
jgi:two-component system, cell cycle response regulator